MCMSSARTRALVLPFIVFLTISFLLGQVPGSFVDSGLYRINKNKAVTLKILVQISGDSWHDGVVR